MKTALLIVGGLLIVFGAVFTLQGLGVIGGGAMAGNRIWAVIGPLIMLVGLGIGFFAVRRARSS